MYSFPLNMKITVVLLLQSHMLCMFVSVCIPVKMCPCILLNVDTLAARTHVSKGSLWRLKYMDGCILHGIRTLTYLPLCVCLCSLFCIWSFGALGHEVSMATESQLTDSHVKVWQYIKHSHLSLSPQLPFPLYPSPPFILTSLSLLDLPYIQEGLLLTCWMRVI